VVRNFRGHPEVKSAGPGGRPCGRGTVGQLHCRVARPTYAVHVGKETNKLEEVEAGLEHDLEEVWTEFADLQRDPWKDLVLLVLKRMPARELAAATALSERAVKAIKNGRSSPWTGIRDGLIRCEASFARPRLVLNGVPAPPDDLSACAAPIELEAVEPDPLPR